MIPCLFYGSATEYSTNGIGRLSDCTRCIVTESRNAEYELEFDYPVSGVHFDQILIGRIVTATHDDNGDIQPFVIYRRSAEIGGMVTFNAYHISYNLSYTVVDLSGETFTLAGLMEAFSDTGENSYILAGDVFAFSTDITSAAEYEWPTPTSIKSILFGQQGSVLDVYGGEFEFDNHSVILHKSRGSDNGVMIRYGKNLSDLKDVQEGINLYSKILPYWYKEDTGTLVVGSITEGVTPEYWTEHNDAYITDENDTKIEFVKGIDRCVAMDFTNDFQNEPTRADLNARAAEYLNSNKPWIPKRDITFSFIPLWQTINVSQSTTPDVDRVHLCDTVKVIYEKLGVVATAKVITVKWDTLLDRFDSITVGQIVDQTVGYTGKLTIGGKAYRVNNGLITAVN